MKKLNESQKDCLSAIRKIEMLQWFGESTAKTTAFLRKEVKQNPSTYLRELGEGIYFLLIKYFENLYPRMCKLCSETRGICKIKNDIRACLKASFALIENEKPLKKRIRSEFVKMFGDDPWFILGEDGFEQTEGVEANDFEDW